MNYQRIYNNLIEYRLISIPEGRVENHHIIPRCLGGSDDITNLVKLTAREHFIAHQLLVKIHKDNQKLIYAAFRMSHYQSNNIKSKQYGWLKEQYEPKGGFYLKDKTYEEIMGIEKAKEVKIKRSIAMKKHNDLGVTGGAGNNNPMHKSKSGKDDGFYRHKSLKAYNTRRLNNNDTHSEETKRKISETLRSKVTWSKKVSVYDLDLNLIQIFKSITEAALFLNSNGAYLGTILSHNSRIFKKIYYVRYADEI